MGEIKAILMDEQTLLRSVARMAHEIIERNRGVDGLCLVGIKRRGEPLAELIAERIYSIEGVRVPCASADVSLYRDDLSEISDSPVMKELELPFSVAGKRVVLVDDVIFTGRTARAALEGVLSCGRPQLVQLAVLIDRGHRELPIRPDYVGKNIPTSRDEKVSVMLPPYDGETGVWLCKAE